MRLTYHKARLKSLMTEYVRGLGELDCGRELAKNMLSWVIELENKMDVHIEAINKLDNQKFKLFRDGYTSPLVFN